MFYGTFFYLSDEQSKDTKMDQRKNLRDSYITHKFTSPKTICDILQVPKRFVIFSQNEM